MKYLSLFSGYGGFELGIQQAYEEIWKLKNAQNAERPQKYTQGEPSVVNAKLQMERGGEKKTESDTTNSAEIKTSEGEIKSLKPMEENVPVAEKQHQSSLQLTTLTEEETKTGKNGVQEDYIYQSLSGDFQKNTNCSATTATTPKDFMENAPICVGFSEIDRYAIQVYKHKFPYEECENCRLERNRQENLRLSGRQETLDSAGTDLPQAERPDRRSFNSPSTKNNCQCKHKPYGDITTINPAELPDFDLLVGGFPCQAFSIAGKRGGFDDTRGTLIYDVFRILKEKHPRLVLLENVKGLLSHDHGRTFKTIITTLNELGYAVEWQVLNAKNFGVPQNRERVFIVGHLGGFGGRQIFPITNASGKNLKYVGAVMSEKNKQWLDDGKKFSRNFPQGQRVYSTEGISSTLSSNAGGLGGKTGLYKVAPTIRATEYKHGDNQTFVKINQKNNSVNESDTTCTLSARDYKGFHGRQDNNAIIKNSRIRRLTPTECERLMGLPDGWTEGVSDTRRYQLCGNGVVIPVVKEIMIRLIKNYE